MNDCESKRNIYYAFDLRYCWACEAVQVLVQFCALRVVFVVQMLRAFFDNSSIRGMHWNSLTGCFYFWSLYPVRSNCANPENVLLSFSPMFFTEIVVGIWTVQGNYLCVTFFPTVLVLKWQCSWSNAFTVLQSNSNQLAVTMKAAYRSMDLLVCFWGHFISELFSPAHQEIQWLWHLE